MKTLFKDIREELNLSLREMASLAGVSITTIYALETGNRDKINTNVKHLLERLDYDVDEVTETYHYQRQKKAEELFKGIIEAV